MNIHIIQHVEFEGPGHIRLWAEKNNHTVSMTKLFNNENLPSADSFDLLVVMGGPMGIYDYELYPWLHEEKNFIKKAVSAGKSVLGVCLGAQLIADVLGAEVFPGENKEIGWWEINRTPEAEKTEICGLLPEKIKVFHWHGDTFEIPPGAVRLYSSAACANQAFIYNDKVIALQFHLETTEDSMKAILGNCGAEIVDAPYIQPENQITENSSFTEINSLMERILNFLEC